MWSFLKGRLKYPRFSLGSQSMLLKLKTEKILDSSAWFGLDENLCCLPLHLSAALHRCTFTVESLLWFSCSHVCNLKSAIFPVKNFLILTAEKQQPLMGSQAAHVIELVSVPQLQQCLSYSEWEPNSAVLSGWERAPEPSRGAHSHPNPTAGAKGCFSSIPNPATQLLCCKRLSQPQDPRKGSFRSKLAL